MAKLNRKYLYRFVSNNHQKDSFDRVHLPIRFDNYRSIANRIAKSNAKPHQSTRCRSRLSDNDESS